MGLKVSATCELSFGQHGIPAKGWLVGEVHEGIAQMFDVIEQTRMMVGPRPLPRCRRVTSTPSSTRRSVCRAPI